MPSIAQRSFSGGELSPALDARTDISKYAFGLKTCRNAVVMKEGGVQNRPGTVLVGETKFRGEFKNVRLEEFDFGIGQTYILEFGDEYIRFIKDGQYLGPNLKQAIEGITSASEAVISATAHGRLNGQEVIITGMTGDFAVLNNKRFFVSDKTANDFKIKDRDGNYVDTSGFTAWVSGGDFGWIYEIVSPYSDSDIEDIYLVQSADVVIIAHPDYPLKKLSRLGDTNWTIGDYTIGSGVGTTTVSITKGAAGSLRIDYVVVAVDEFGNEGPASTSIDGISSAAQGTVGSPHVVTWSAVLGAARYLVYRRGPFSASIYTGYGNTPISTPLPSFHFIGVTTDTTFSDIGFTADTQDYPAGQSSPFGSSNNYPSVVGFFEQRLVAANTNNNQERIWMSQTGRFNNFNKSSVVQDDDAIEFVAAGRKFNPIKHVLDLQNMIVFTEDGEFVVRAADGGGISPGNVSIKQHSYNGASKLRPIMSNGTALYVQESGSIVRDIGFNFESDGYRGDDLTIFSSHLFKEFELVSWCYQKIPDGIIWAVRDDGKIVAITYNKEQSIISCHRHDFDDGTAESIASIREGLASSVYVAVKRTLGNTVIRTVERFASRVINDPADMIFMDSAVSFDGRNDNPTHTMTATSSGGWEYDDDINIQSSNALYFSADDEGMTLKVYAPDGELVQFLITAFVDAENVTARPDRTVPASMRSVALNVWSRTVKSVSGLDHLEGRDVSVLGDGFVESSPYNPDYDTLTVVNGEVEFDTPHAVVHVGLPITTDIQTLDIDTPQGDSLMGKKKRISEVVMNLLQTRGVFAGPEEPDDNGVGDLSELQIRENEDYDSPVSLFTGKESINIKPDWNDNGRVFIRQVDPLPMTILAIAPESDIQRE